MKTTVIYLPPATLNARPSQATKLSPALVNEINEINENIIDFH
jgi:hypothetical protein